jgi:aromatic-L-amino-acid decarboxylase
VDAAFAGSAAILPEMRWILDGAEQADSLVMNPHKWLLVNFDCSAYFVRDVPALLRSFSASAEILKTVYDDAAINYRDWGIPLGRRFRALKVWFVIRSYGVAGLQAMLREHIRLGKLFAGWVAAHPDFEQLGAAPLATVCFRLRGADADARTQRLLARLNATGKLFLTGTRLNGHYVVRLALGHLTTTETDVRKAWELITAVNSEP